MKYTVPFSAEATRDGYWEIFHDDDCGALIVDRHCTKCKFFVGLQSLGARPTAKNLPFDVAQADSEEPKR